MVTAGSSLLLLSACGEEGGGTDGGGAAGGGEAASENGVTGGSPGQSPGGRGGQFAYPEIDPDIPSCELIGEVSGGDVRTLDGNGCSAYKNDIKIDAANWEVTLDVASSFAPIEPGPVPLEEVRYRFRTNEEAGYSSFSVSGASCEVTVTNSVKQGSAIPSLEGSYVITGTAKCDAPLVAVSGSGEPVTISPFAFRAIYRPE